MPPSKSSAPNSSHFTRLLVLFVLYCVCFTSLLLSSQHTFASLFDSLYLINYDFDSNPCSTIFAGCSLVERGSVVYIGNNRANLAKKTACYYNLKRTFHVILCARFSAMLSGRPPARKLDFFELSREKNCAGLTIWISSEVNTVKPQFYHSKKKD